MRTGALVLLLHGGQHAVRQIKPAQLARQIRGMPGRHAGCHRFRQAGPQVGRHDAGAIRGVTDPKLRGM